MNETRPFRPDWLSPPGDTIEDLLEERGWSQVELAERLGFTPKHVNDLLKAKIAISPDAAGRLARVFGPTSDFWLVREAQYQADLEHRRALEAGRAQSTWLKELPLSWLRKQGWIRTLKDKGEQVLEVLDFFGVASVEAWRSRYEQPVAAFRASGKVEKRSGAVAAWLRQAELRATHMTCAPFDRGRFRKALDELRALTTESDPTTFVSSLKERCAQVGVAVVFVPAPPGCPASGATRWLTRDKAMLVLSLRHKTNDHLWFTFFHEAAHLVLHGKKMLFIEGLAGLDQQLEEEANRFAGDLLIPASTWRNLKARFDETGITKTQVRELASSIGVAPAIIVGRMQNEGWLPWNRMNDLKIRYDWAAPIRTEV